MLGFILEEPMGAAKNEGQVGQILTPRDAMALAIQFAYRGATGASPNPLVGSVLVDRNHRLIQCGYHEKFGSAHAEVNALRGVSEIDIEGGTLYVTLEPCAHQGKTPSCARMIANLKLKKVVYGLVDPNPLVSGQGAQIISEAGILCEKWSEDDLTTELEEVAEVFLKNFQNKQPFVALKIASTMDGFTGLKSGESQWITNEASRSHVHYLRACYQAVVVSAKTLLHDNAELNIRRSDLQKTNQVVILDFRAELFSKDSQISGLKIWSAHQAVDIFWVLPKNTQARGDIRFKGQLIYCECLSSGEFDLRELMSLLFSHGIKSILVEAGGTLSSFFIQQQVVDRLYHYMGTSFVGQKSGQSWNQNMAALKLSEKKLLKNPKVRIFRGLAGSQITTDVLTTGRL